MWSRLEKNRDRAFKFIPDQTTANSTVDLTSGAQRTSGGVILVRGEIAGAPYPILCNIFFWVKKSDKTLVIARLWEAIDERGVARGSLLKYLGQRLDMRKIFEVLF